MVEDEVMFGIDMFFHLIFFGCLGDGGCAFGLTIEGGVCQFPRPKPQLLSRSFR